MKRSYKTVFTRREWYFTCADENLFNLSWEERFFFRAIVRGAP